jgi:CRISPR-associated endoribonuclease Cas6
LSSPKQEFLDFLLKEIFKMDEIELGELILNPESTELEEVDEMDKEMKFICISPIVAIHSGSNSNHDKRLVSPESDEFSDLLYDSTLERMEDSMRFSKEKMNSFNKFQFVPDQGYLNKLKAKDKKFARIYAVTQDDNRHEVRGYTLPFKLHAAPEVQQFIFNCGLGNYTDKGFGMLDLANVGSDKKTSPYTFSKVEKA